jgi:hypothetical protein
MVQSLTGRTFGRLTVQDVDRVDSNHRRYWRCLCTCGAAVVVRSDSLIRGQTTSCGCLAIENARGAGGKAKTHGHTLRKKPTREYRIWSNMMGRCHSPTNAAYDRYGGRGIVVCDQWHRFENFIADMGPCPPGLTLERENNDGNYEPSNCHWATRLEQGNNKRNNVRHTAFGKTQTLPQWAREVGLKLSTLGMRVYRYRWPIERALTEPVHF